MGNDNAMRGGKTAMAKLESRIRELEIELGNVQTRTGDNMKSYQKAERKIKELQFQNDEDRKNQDRMSDLAGKLQQKIKTYKKQIEEAEEIAALTWPSSARPSRSWRRPRTAPDLLRTPCTPPTKHYRVQYRVQGTRPDRT